MPSISTWEPSGKTAFLGFESSGVVGTQSQPKTVQVVPITWRQLEILYIGFLAEIGGFNPILSALGIHIPSEVIGDCLCRRQDVRLEP